MKIEIKHKLTGAILFSCEAESIKIAVELAVKASANLRYANLRSADLQSANLRYANLRSADLQSANLQYANLRYANLQSANLRYANLRYADLRYANLRYANLDFSCWPLWCGSKQVKVDIALVYQLVAHLCVVDCDDKIFKRIQKFLLPFAKKFKRWGELSK